MEEVAVEHDTEIQPKARPPRVEDLLEKLGGYSWYQLFLTVVIILPEIPGAMITLSPVLTGRSSGHYACQIQNETFNLTPTNAADLTQICILANNCSLTGELPFTSIVQEWDLICDRAWIVDTLTSVQMGGAMCGAILAAHLADTFGRRTMFFSLCFLMGSFGLASGWATNLLTYGGARLGAGFAVGGMYVVYVNYLMEFLTPSYRTICGCISVWSLGEMILALIGYTCPHWRDLSFLIALPPLFLLAVFPWVPESPRWLLCQGRTQDAETVFMKMAVFNRKEPLRRDELEKVQAEIQGEEKRGSSGRLSLLGGLLGKGQCCQLMVLSWAWFCISVVYYGLSFNTKHLSGDPYLNVVYLGISDMPGCFSAIYFNNRFGRKLTLCGSLCLTAALLISLVVLEEGWVTGVEGSVLTGLALTARYAVTASWATLTCFTAESFPTSTRATAMGLCALVGNIGGIISPQLVFLGTKWRGGPYVAFGILSITTAGASFALDEMSGKPLEDSVMVMPSRTDTEKQSPCP